MWKWKASIGAISGTYLSICGDLSGNQEPEQTLRERFFSTGSPGEELLALWDAVATKTDALLGIQHRGLCDEALHATHASIQL